MILFFGSPSEKVYAVQTTERPSANSLSKLTWLFGDRSLLPETSLVGRYIGPRATMITPWSTNAVEITQNMVVDGIQRIEEFYPVLQEPAVYDPMIAELYDSLDQDIFTINIEPENIIEIDDIAAYNQHEGLSLSTEEIDFLQAVSDRIGRKLTDSEIFGFSQVNSEHCRHKIFNGTFVIDGEEKDYSLFKLIKQTTELNPNGVVSAYKDNVAFIDGPTATQFAPHSPDRPDYYEKKEFDSVISLKAETHNFPTTVEPFNGAATGSGGEIRDRMAGGTGSIPLAGTAVYMTSYSRLNNNRKWEEEWPESNWLYQTPLDILIKASNGASDFGNKFGQPLISGSVLTFEHEEGDRRLGYDKVIMMAGGIGYGKESMALKGLPQPGDKIVILGGDNYRIGMGGAAVSSADTGEFSSGIELNAVQRSNPEMQKRACNTVRALVESEKNPIVSIHDHGAGGHLNCLSELVEETGGYIDLDQLPIGDPTLSAKEIIGNESQERMGLIVSEADLPLVKKIADRERSPLYVVGEVTGNKRFTFESGSNNSRPMDLELEDMFGSTPKTVMIDRTIYRNYDPAAYKQDHFYDYLKDVLKLEAVACKDWLTNKVDRCVGGLVAKQQCAGPLQLPLNNCGVMALDYEGRHGVATAIGHAPISGLIDPAAGSRNAIAEALTNIIWAPLKDGIKSVSLSANWMWPCKNPGEDARLYKAVEAVSEMAKELGINVPTGKDSLSMKQKYPDREVLSPGTVIISAAGHCHDISKVVEPVLKKAGGPIYYLDISGSPHRLGGSSFSQTLNKIGNSTPDIKDPGYLKRVFNTVQEAILQEKICAGHDISAGGMITTLLEMCFADNGLGAQIDLTGVGEEDNIKLMFSENSGIIIQSIDASVEELFIRRQVAYHKIGTVRDNGQLTILNGSDQYTIDVAEYRNVWYETSYLLDKNQTTESLAVDRYDNYKNQPLTYQFPDHFEGKLPGIASDTNRPKAAVIREKGSNSERELAHALWLAGFEVRDVHMTDLISGRETLEDVRFIGAVGGFANSDVLGSAKGWAGAFLYNEKAKKSLDNFFKRDDVLSVGICNGCQLFMELNLINPHHEQKGFMDYNDSGKHESAFTSVQIEENNSVMLSSLKGCRLGVWVSNGEGKYVLPHDEGEYHVVAKYGYPGYPSDPNGSDFNTAMLCSPDGRHLVTMPHIERSMFQWNWAYYPEGRKDEVSPWLEAFVNARKWLVGMDS